jgi:hypothetical protein
LAPATPAQAPVGLPVASWSSSLRLGLAIAARDASGLDAIARADEPIFAQPKEVFMLRKTLLALGVAAVLALAPSVASAQRGFHGGGFSRGFVGGGGWRGGGWGGGGWRGGGWRGGGWGWRGPAIGLGLGLGLASAAAWGPGWGAPGWGWGAPGWGYAGWDGCTRWRRVWTGWGWRLVPVNVCW